MSLKHSHKEFGSEGERRACRFLETRGCSILCCNYRTRFGEVDIIAQHGNVLCFVEVKSRHGSVQGHPFEAVTSVKQRQIIRTALTYLQETKLADVRMRFDVIAVMGDSEDDIQWLTNAFDAM